MGWVGSYYEKMSPAQFWILDGGIAGMGAVLILLFGRTLHRALEPA
jgi:POT family proton-dependent oligopeptide transporter